MWQASPPAANSMAALLVNRPATLRMLWAVLRDNPPQSTKGGYAHIFDLFLYFFAMRTFWYPSLNDLIDHGAVQCRNMLLLYDDWHRDVCTHWSKSHTTCRPLCEGVLDIPLAGESLWQLQQVINGTRSHAQLLLRNASAPGAGTGRGQGGQVPLFPAFWEFKGEACSMQPLPGTFTRIQSGWIALVLSGWIALV